ncbi:MAG: MtrB/PioB family outer membrane beta-barrel protein [Nitrospirota bacterium]|nr:MtrB/PioB family outer membrane beta-barrel protein [Nitrospirota bacterium]
MKKLILSCLCLTLLAAPVMAQETQRAGGKAQSEPTFEGELLPGYRWVTQEGSPMSGEYEYLHSSAGGSAFIEYDPLPNRFLLEMNAVNGKDYFGEMDYSFGDIFMLSGMARSLFHNIYHVSLGQDDPATTSPLFQDYNAEDAYGVQDAMNRLQVRIKTPDFPFHIYLEGKTQTKEGLVQQRFLSAFSGSGGFSKGSRSREVDWTTKEAKATVNSHLGSVEVEYSHANKQFSPTYENRVVTDTESGTGTISNLVPSLESSSDMVKIHTSHSGRIAAAGTYVKGEKLNNDSDTKVLFSNAAGDLTLIPWKELTISVKYRHFDVSQETPDFVTLSGITSASAGTGAFSVRNALDYKKDQVSGLVRFRATQNLTVRAEYAWDSQTRTTWPGYDLLPSGDPAYWALDERISRTTAKLGATYRFTSRLYLRGDVSRQSADIPPTSLDNTYPERTDVARGTLTWTPSAWFSMLLSGGTTHEERDLLAAPLSGAKTSDRNRVLGSFTFLVGKKTSITPSYSLFQNSMVSAIAYRTDTGSITAETDVPYADTAHVGSLAVSHVVDDVITITAEAGRAYLRGNYRSAAVVPGSEGIQNLSDLKSVETTGSAEVQLQFTKYLGSEVRYLFRKIDDILDNEQDGTTQLIFAGLTYKW